MRGRLASGLLILAITGAGCAAKTAPPAPPPTAAADAARIARVVRLMELNRHRVALQIEHVGLSQRYGENHPDMRRLRAQMETIDAELKREFLPEEQAAVARYDDRALQLRLQLAEHRGRGRGENHPDVVTVRMQLEAVEEMARQHRTPERDEALLQTRIAEAPDSAELQIELALLHLRASRTQEAGQALERALALLKGKRIKR